MKLSTSLLAAACVLVAAATPARAGELETIFFKNDQESLQAQAQAQLRRAPTDPEANAWQAEMAMKQGLWTDAHKALDHAGTTTVLGLLAHGDFEWYTGDFAASQKHFQAALAKDPGNQHALWGVSSALLHENQFDPALKLAEQLQAASKADDPDFQAWVLVLVGACKGLKAEQGNMIEKLRLAGEVKGDFERAVALSPKNPNALSALGRFYLLAPPILGDNDKAVEYLDRANTMDPYFFLNDAYLIRALAKDGQPDKARVEKVFYRAKFQGLERPMAELATLEK